jgi:hypothetical protein
MATRFAAYSNPFVCALLISRAALQEYFVDATSWFTNVADLRASKFSSVRIFSGGSLEDIIIEEQVAHDAAGIQEAIAHCGSIVRSGGEFVLHTGPVMR